MGKPLSVSGVYWIIRIHSTIAPLRGSVVEELLLDVPESCLLYGAVIPLYLDKTKGAEHCRYPRLELSSQTRSSVGRRSTGSV